MKRKFLAALVLIALVTSWGVFANAVTKPEKISVEVITDSTCEFCSVDEAQNKIKSYWPQAVFSRMDYRAKPAQDLIAKYGIKTLPCLLISSKIKNTDAFKDASDNFSEVGDRLLLKTDKAGMFLFLNRPYAASEITYFFDFYDYRTKNTFPLLAEFCKDKKIKLNIKIIVPTIAVPGYPQQEISTALAVAQNYPDKFFDYLNERINFIETLDCTTSAAKMGMDINVILKAISPPLTGKLLADNEVLAKELGITNGNAILVNNRRLFMIMKAKPKDFAKIVNHK